MWVNARCTAHQSHCCSTVYSVQRDFKIGIYHVTGLREVLTLWLDFAPQVDSKASTEQDKGRIISPGVLVTCDLYTRTCHLGGNNKYVRRHFTTKVISLDSLDDFSFDFERLVIQTN